MTRDLGLGREFLDAAKAAPFLDREEEHLLAVRWRDDGDEHSLHRLTSSHMRLVIAIASRFRHYGLPLADLVQEGHVGLLEAAARFDPSREVRFSTYATWWIRASIQDHVLRNWSIVRGGTSSGQKALFFGLRRLRAHLTRTGNEGPSTTEMHGEVAARLGVSKADVALMDWRLSAPDQSLNATLGEDEAGAERMELLPDDAPLPDETVSEQIDGNRRRQWLRTALAVLSEREFKIVSARRLTDDAVTLESLGARLGISKERVRQIENRALEKLRRKLMEGHPAGALAFS